MCVCIYGWICAHMHTYMYIYTHICPLDKDVDLDKIAESTENMSPAYLASITNEVNVCVYVWMDGYVYTCTHTCIFTIHAGSYRCCTARRRKHLYTYIHTYDAIGAARDHAHTHIHTYIHMIHAGSYRCCTKRCRENQSRRLPTGGHAAHNITFYVSTRKFKCV